MSDKLKGLAQLSSDSNNSRKQILLVSMPFGPLFYPSIGLSLLKASLTHQNGVSTNILYFTIKFAELINTSLYLRIANGYPATFDLVGEWVFSNSLFGSSTCNVEDYIRDVLYGQSQKDRKEFLGSELVLLENFVQDVLEMRSRVENFLEQCLQEVLSYQPKIVAFTSIFQQQVSALSLAKRIKEKSPDTFILLGGANCEGIMGVEVVSQFDFVDAVISGEGDIVFPQLVQRVLARESVSNLVGVYTRVNAEVMRKTLPHPPNATSVVDMNALPFPDYDDFFEQLSQSSLKSEKTQCRLLFETSRGCWWGQKHHCVFCGLNGSTMNFRSKSSKRAIDELSYLTSKYSGHSVSVADNILDMTYFKNFIPELVQRKLNLELFYEVKSNLRKEQVYLLSEAGITSIQPGIESLSSKVLEMMRKGVKKLQNIQLLKWCKELGVKPYWNMLWGFPGEDPQEYTSMTNLVPCLVHLQPPCSASSIRLDRFSPNFDDPESFGFTNVQPYPSYSYIYPLSSETVFNLAYYFTFEYNVAQNVESYSKALLEQIRIWREAYAESDLFSVDKEEYLLIWDLRQGFDKHLRVLTDFQKELYVACDQICTTRQLKNLVDSCFAQQISELDIEKILDNFVNDGLMVKDDNSYLSLAIPLGNYSPGAKILKKFQSIIEELGDVCEDKVVVTLNSGDHL
jgi:ribosomal peptide maturation radical SAM protein 1